MKKIGKPIPPGHYHDYEDEGAAKKAASPNINRTKSNLSPKVL